MMQLLTGSLPAGFRFEPSDELLVDYYLRNRLCGNSSVVQDCLIKELDIYQYNPEDLPHGDAAFPYRHHMRDNEMYFFTKRHPTSPGSTRVSRSAGGGFWDGRAQYTEITKNGKAIGCRRQFNFKILVNGRRMRKIKTDWIMHEYCLKTDRDPASGDTVLCRIYLKERGAGGVQSASYGTADFGEEEDMDDGRLPKRPRRIEEPGTSPQLYMPSAPAQPWEGVYEPLAYSAADYREPSFPSSVPMMTGVADDYWSSSRAFASLDTRDQASTSASTIPLPGSAYYGAFAQPLPNILNEPVTAIGAEYQVASAEYEVPKEEPVDDIEVCMKWLDDSLTVEPESSNDAGTHKEEPIDDDDDDEAFAKSLEVILTDETSTSYDAANDTSISASTVPSAENQVLSVGHQLPTEDDRIVKRIEDCFVDHPLSSNDAGNPKEEPIDNDDDDEAFAKSLEVILTDETSTSYEAANDTSTSASTVPSVENQVLSVGYQLPTEDDQVVKRIEDRFVDQPLSSNDAGNPTSPASSQHMSLPLEGAHEPLPLTSSDASNRDSSSASTVPMSVVSDDQHASAQARENIMPEEPSTSCDVENQVQMMGSAADYDPDDDPLPLSLDCFPECDLGTVISSLKAYDMGWFNIDEYLC